jgi:hypothetical protein
MTVLMGRQPTFKKFELEVTNHEKQTWLGRYATLPPVLGTRLTRLGADLKC